MRWPLCCLGSGCQCLTESAGSRRIDGAGELAGGGRENHFGLYLCLRSLTACTTSTSAIFASSRCSSFARNIRATVSDSVCRVRTT